MGDLELKDLLKWVLAVGLILFLLIFVFTWNGFHRGESANSSSSSSLSGTNGVCGGVPTIYQKYFEEAGNKWKVQPAFIAAVFSIEHGQPQEYAPGYTPSAKKDGAWPEKDGDPEKVTKWKTSSKGALGPMQFMPGTWEGNKQDGNGDGEKNVQNIKDATYGAAYLLANLGAGGNTTDQNKLREAAAHYNGGNTPPQSSYDDYAKKVLDKYKSYYCASLPDTIDDFIKHILKYSPKPRPMMKDPGPTAIVLHWSGGSTLESLERTLEQRNVTEGIICHLGIDKDGKTYQFMTSLKETSVCQNSWNSHGIGIEIVGVGKNDLMNNSQQFQGVVNTVKLLMQTYNIPAVNDTINQRGILGHYQINSGKADPSEEYLNKVINAAK